MSKLKNLEEIKQFWDSASKSALDHRKLRPVAPDEQLQRLIESRIKPYLKPTWKCLDIGCGDGLSTIKFAPLVKKITAIDYIEGFVERAKKNAAKNSITNIEFQNGNILKLPALTEKNKYDCLITIRCLINLGSWENQKKALSNIAKVVKRGGYAIISEGWHEGVMGVKDYWLNHNLGEFNIPTFNCLIKKSQFEKAIAKDFEIIDYHGFGFYMFMSRIFQPIFVSPEKPHHNHLINKKAEQMLMENKSLEKAFPECDYTGLYVLRKK